MRGRGLQKSKGLVPAEFHAAGSERALHVVVEKGRFADAAPQRNVVDDELEMRFVVDEDDDAVVSRRRPHVSGVWPVSRRSCVEILWRRRRRPLTDRREDQMRLSPAQLTGTFLLEIAGARVHIFLFISTKFDAQIARAN